MTWSTKKLGEIASVRTGKLDANAADDGGAYLFYTCSREISKINDTAFDGESILISGNGEFWVKYHEDGKFNAYQRTYVIQTSDDVFAKYLFLKLTEEVPKLVSQGAIIKYLRLPQLKNIEIPLPPIAEQRRIVEKLEKQFAKIDEAARLRAESLEATDQLLPAALHEIFSEGKQKSWEEKVVEEVTELVTKGTTPKTLGHAFTESGVPFIKAENVNGGPVDGRSTRTFIAKETHKLLARSKTKTGDVLMTIAGTIGRLGWIPERAPEMNTNQAVAIIRPKQDIISTQYLAYVLSAGVSQGQVSTGTVKAAIPNFSLGMIKKIKIPLPPLAEQKRIVKKLDALSEKVRALRELQLAQSADLKAIKQSILHEAFVGGVE